MKKILACLLIVFLFTCMSFAETDANDANSTVDWTKGQHFIKDIVIDTNGINGSLTIATIWGKLRTIMFKTNATADGNDANGLDVTVYNHYDLAIHSEVNVTSGLIRAFQTFDANGNPYGDADVAGPVDVNWWNNPYHADANALQIIILYESSEPITNY